MTSCYAPAETVPERMTVSRIAQLLGRGIEWVQRRITEDPALSALGDDRKDRVGHMRRHYPRAVYIALQEPDGPPQPTEASRDRLLDVPLIARVLGTTIDWVEQELAQSPVNWMPETQYSWEGKSGLYYSRWCLSWLDRRLKEAAPEKLSLAEAAQALDRPAGWIAATLRKRPALGAVVYLPVEVSGQVVSWPFIWRSTYEQLQQLIVA